jgi:adenine specific DNA methylase Mod
LFKELIRATTNKNSIVLDYFAGSGTTGHAVMDLNKEDNGERNFILINDNQNNIYHSVTKQRIQKVINKYKYKIIIKESL